jgi:hypothetical protein
MMTWSLRANNAEEDWSWTWGCDLLSLLAAAVPSDMSSSRMFPSRMFTVCTGEKDRATGTIQAIIIIAIVTITITRMILMIY